jgi:hypothetical protein
MTRAEIWGLEKGWKVVGNIHKTFCKQVMAARGVEVCTGPGPGPRAGYHRLCSGSGRVQMIAIKRCIEHFGISRAIFFNKEKCIRNCSQLMLVTQSKYRKTWRHLYVEQMTSNHVGFN